jgi:hypothetical protein
MGKQEEHDHHRETAVDHLIQPGAFRGDLTEASREEAVEPICHRREREDGEQRPSPISSEEQVPERRREKQPRHRERVGEIHERKAWER